MNMCKRCGSNQIQIINVRSLKEGTFKVTHFCLECATNWTVSSALIWMDNEPFTAGKVLA